MSTAAAVTTWHDANQRYLMAALGLVRHALQRYVSGAPAGEDASDDEKVRRTVRDAASAMPAPPALDTLCASFALSQFERDLLLLCAGVELDSSVAGLCAAAQGDPRRVCPTFSLALAALPLAHWSALTPDAPLRRWRFIDVGPAETLTVSPLRIDERILHYLVGVSYLDERLRGLVEPVGPVDDLPPSLQTLAGRLSRLWLLSPDAPGRPAVHLCGGDPDTRHTVAAQACAALGMRLHAIRAAHIPAAAAEREALARLWEREAVLGGSALLVDCDDLDGAESVRAALAFLENVRGVVIAGSREPLRTGHHSVIRLDVPRPHPAEQRHLWESALGPLAARVDGQIEAVVRQFNLSPKDIQGVAAAMRAAPVSEEAGGPTSAEDFGRVLWEACRTQARPRLDDLAQRIEPAAAWDDLVLPSPQRQTLRDIAAHVRRRSMVYDAWGFAGKGARGLGISALFTGASGTGKTMAAEVLANELRLDLYRIDLSAVVSKYIGETEKNLRRVFDAAEEGGAILLFDEADALFGKRSEVKDSHDRYANIEVGYLLQRMEAYRGLAILTTNMKEALDSAFLRRIRFIVTFPFPDAAQRAEIWRRIFPVATPTDALDPDRLAQLNVAGGGIRNIALGAAFLAADAGEPVRMPHLLRAARGEYAKLEKPLTDAETRDWA